MNEATFSLEDMFLVVFTLIDDLYTEHVPLPIRKRSQRERITFSDSEVITHSIMQQALSNDSKRSFHRFVEKNFLHLFPRLITRDRYHRRRKALMGVQELLFGKLSRVLSLHAQWLVVDSFPIETTQFVRSQSGKRSIPEADYGYIPAKKRHFFGLRLHPLITESGLITDTGAVVGFTLAAANSDERSVAAALLAEHNGQVVLADNGFSGERMSEEAARYEHTMLASPRPGQKPTSKAEARCRRWLRSKRDLIETVGSVLADQFKIETTRARSLWGVATRACRQAPGLQTKHLYQPNAR